MTVPVSFNLKEFLTAQRFGMLATHSHRHPGFPFGSIVPYSIDAQSGVCSILVATIAEHYKNLWGNPRSSLLVVDAAEFAEPQAHPRVTLLMELKEDASALALNKFLERHPAGVDPEIAHSFRLFSALPQSVRWIAGFGEMGWVDSEKYRELYV